MAKLSQQHSGLTKVTDAEIEQFASACLVCMKEMNTLMETSGGRCAEDAGIIGDIEQAVQLVEKFAAFKLLSEVSEWYTTGGPIQWGGGCYTSGCMAAIYGVQEFVNAGDMADYSKWESHQTRDLIVSRIRQECLRAVRGWQMVHAAKSPKKTIQPPLRVGSPAHKIYAILVSLKPHEAMTRPQIIERLGQDETFMDEKKFGRAMTELKRWGLQNVPKKGYRIVLESK